MADPPPAGYQRAYLPRGAVAHYISDQASLNTGATARCGKNHDGEWYWFGNGSQDEIDRLTALRDCASCVNLVYWDEKKLEWTRQTLPNGLWDKWA